MTNDPRPSTTARLWTWSRITFGPTSDVPSLCTSPGRLSHPKTVILFPSGLPSISIRLPRTSVPRGLVGSAGSWWTVTIPSHRAVFSWYFIPPVAGSALGAGGRSPPATPAVAAGGAALRYGWLYGPGATDDLVAPVRKRQFPLVGGGTGYTSWVHMDDAASATVLAVEQQAKGVFNIVDDEPARVSEWLPYLAELAGAKPPMRVPTWLARLLAGDVAVIMMTEGRAFSNAKAKHELGWQPRHPSWRVGFKEELA